ncbi:MAG: hypothetical protein NVS1B7_7260 [Candidatus Saccharimonadales bacterium]
MDQKPDNNTLETLEDPSTSTGEPASTKSPETVSSAVDSDSLEGGANKDSGLVDPIITKKKVPIFRRIVSRLNIYFLLFVLIVVFAVGLVLVGISRNKKVATPPSIGSQQLSQEALKKLSGSDATVGDAKQTLTIQSNAIFNQAVLVKGTLDVAGAIKVGGALNLPGITVAGNSSFDQITANKLSIAGDTIVQGQLSVQKGLTVSGGASFGGPISAPQLTVQSLQLTSDLQVNKHIISAGITPNKSDGPGIGGGGTTSVSGTDTAGTISINFGGGASGNSCYVTVNFVVAYPNAPHVVISPTSATAGQLNYYVTRNAGSFQVCSSGGNATGNASFDYIVID